MLTRSAETSASVGQLDSEHGAQTAADTRLKQEVLLARVLCLAVALQYCMSVLACGALGCSYPKHHEPKEYPLCNQDASLLFATVVVVLGFLLFSARTLFVALGMLSSWRESAVCSDVSSHLVRFFGVMGAPLLFIEAIYLQYAVGSKEFFSDWLTVSAALEAGLVATSLCLPSHESSSVVYNYAWRAEEPQDVETLVCHSCRPVHTYDVEEGDGKGDACLGCKAAQKLELDRRGAGAFYLRDRKVEDLQCSICLTQCEEGEVLGKLVCGHLFHRACIQTWIGRGGACPMRCRLRWAWQLPAESSGATANEAKPESECTMEGNNHRVVFLDL